MKIGILTFHHTTNYGATLQAVALYNYLKSQHADVSIIDYKPMTARFTYFKTNYITRHLIANRRKQALFDAFLTAKTILVSPKSHTLQGLEQLSREFDMMIAGSDEIWNFDSFRGFDEAFFLGFGTSKLIRASYAASFGQAKNYSPNTERLRGLLSNFNHISVRDNNTFLRVKEFSSHQPTMVLDPTFLIDFSPMIASNITSGKKYILLYGYISEALKGEIYEMAKRQDLRVISVGYHNKMAEVNLLSAGPAEWLDLIKNAHFVYTNFYHGLLFSVIFNRPYKFLVSESKLNKVKDILDRLELKTDYRNEFEQGNNINLRQNTKEHLDKSKTYLQHLLNN